MPDEQKMKMIAALLARPSNALARPQALNTLSRQTHSPLIEALFPTPQVPSTYLPPDRETQYRAWLASIGQTPGSGYNVDNNWSGTDYDYRGFFAKYGPADVRNGQHFTDEFKLPNHPTFSNESVYATGPPAQYAGSWEGNAFMPSPLALLRGKRRFTE